MEGRREEGRMEIPRSKRSKEEGGRREGSRKEGRKNEGGKGGAPNALFLQGFVTIGEIRRSETLIFMRFPELKGSETVIFKGSLSRDHHFFKG